MFGYVFDKEDALNVLKMYWGDTFKMVFVYTKKKNASWTLNETFDLSDHDGLDEKLDYLKKHNVEFECKEKSLLGWNKDEIDLDRIEMLLQKMFINLNLKLTIDTWGITKYYSKRENPHFLISDETIAREHLSQKEGEVEVSTFEINNDENNSNRDIYKFGKTIGFAPEWHLCTVLENYF